MPLNLKLSPIFGFRRFPKHCFERKHLSCDLFWQFVVGDQLADHGRTFTEVFSVTGKGCALEIYLILPFCFNYLHKADIFPWLLFPAWRRFATADPQSAERLSWAPRVPVHFLTSSGLRRDPRESLEQTQGVVSRLSSPKKLAHSISPFFSGFPPLYCFFRLQ